MKYILPVGMFCLIQALFFWLYIDSELSVKVSSKSINKAVSECSGGFVNIRPYKAVSDGLYMETLCQDGQVLRIRIN